MREHEPLDIHEIIKIMAKRFCSQRRFWPEACLECSNSPWPKCNNIIRSRFSKFEKALSAWSIARSRKEDIRLYERLRLTFTEKLHDCHWDRVFIISGKLSAKFPESRAEKEQAKKDFESLPEYVPLPGKGEVLAVFLGRRR